MVVLHASDRSHNWQINLHVLATWKLCMLTSAAAVIKFHTYPLVFLEEVGECPWNDPSVSIALSPSSDRECLARTSLSMY